MDLLTIKCAIYGEHQKFCKEDGKNPGLAHRNKTTRDIDMQISILA